MKELVTESKTIKKYTDILTDEECDLLYNYTFSKTNNPVTDPNKVPWELEGKTNTLYYQSVDDENVKNILIKYRNTLADDLTKKEGVPIYPHLTTLVLWKPGQQMPRHVDDGNGYPGRAEQLGMRYMTSVTYLNDNFEGGYTYVKDNDDNDQLWRTRPELHFPNDVFKDYISKPEKGATIVFYGDDRNAHGVSRLESGDRIVLSTWFTKDERYKELDDIFVDIERVNASQQMQLQNKENQPLNQENQNQPKASQAQGLGFNQEFKPDFQQAQQAWRKK